MSERRAVDVAQALGKARLSGSGWTCLCPAHNDKEPSLSVRDEGDKLLVYCFAGCEQEDVIEALKRRDLWPAQEAEDRGGVTLEAYAGAKRLPVEFLNQEGVTEVPYNGRRAVRFPHKGPDGKLLATHFRIAMSGEDRFRWKAGDKTVLYGQHRLDDAREAGRVVLVEGETDCLTLWLHNIPAIGLSGATSWREDRDAALLDGIDEIIVVVEPDKGGEAVKEWISRSAIRHRVRLLSLPVKDTNEFYLQEPLTFDDRWHAACEKAVPWADPLKNGHDPRQPIVRATLRELMAMTFGPKSLKFIVPGYIAEGCTLLAGRPKIGKSWMVYDIGYAVATAGYCLGDIKCSQAGVLYISLEDNLRRLKSRMQKITAGMGVEEWPDNLHLATEWPRANEGGLEKLDEYLKAHPDIRLVAIDVLAGFAPVARSKTMTQYQADYQAIKDLTALAARRRIAIIVVHHLRKGAGDADPIDKISGTLGLAGAADALIIIDRDTNGVTTLYARGRDIEEIEAAAQFSRDTCRWIILGKAADIRQSEQRGAILAALEEAGGSPMTAKEVAAATGMKHPNVQKLLQKMVAEGTLRKPDRTHFAKKTPLEEPLF